MLLSLIWNGFCNNFWRSGSLNRGFKIPSPSCSVSKSKISFMKIDSWKIIIEIEFGMYIIQYFRFLFSAKTIQNKITVWFSASDKLCWCGEFRCCRCECVNPKRLKISSSTFAFNAGLIYSTTVCCIPKTMRKSHVWKGLVNLYFCCTNNIRQHYFA